LDITFGKPVYVTAIRPETNTVVLGDEEDLDEQEMTVAKINWMKYEGATPGMEAITKVRYRDPGTLSLLFPDGGDAARVRVRFYEKAKSIAPWQSAVFYEGDEVIGGGIIQQRQQ
jgi:tRNA-specific 2-thiouridylase